jgi:arsenate reductase (thioredoxin)
MSDGHYNVLFLSNRNTARSIFAEAVMNRVGRENFTGFSAGMRPADHLDPLVCDILRVAQYPTDGLYPKHLEGVCNSRRPTPRLRIHAV